jgi:quinol-cytochrome oxidoreductase complex cytochrome b subunit
MNSLSWLIYLAGVAGTLNGFIVFVTVVFGLLAGTSIVVCLFTLDETDAYRRKLPEDDLVSQREVRKKSWRYMWIFMILMIMSGLTASMVPNRQTVLLIAASQMGEQVLNHPRINQVVDPGIELLTTWMQKETADLRRASEPNRAR